MSIGFLYFFEKILSADMTSGRIVNTGLFPKANNGDRPVFCMYFAIKKLFAASGGDILSQHVLFKRDVHSSESNKAVYKAETHVNSVVDGGIAPWAGHGMPRKVSGMYSAQTYTPLRVRVAYLRNTPMTVPGRKPSFFPLKMPASPRGV